MNINLPKASVGLGTSGIGDNFARSRLLMAQKAGYVQSTPSPYSQPGTALKQYQTAAPLLSAVAKAQGQKGIPGLVRQGMLGRPPMAGVPGQNGSLVNTPTSTYQSTVAGRAVGNPFANLGQPPMPLNQFNRNQNQVSAAQQPPHVTPDNIAANPKGGGSVMPGNGGYVIPGPYRPGGTPIAPDNSHPGALVRPGVPQGGIVGPIPPGQPMPPWTGPYPPGTIGNFSAIPGLTGLPAGLLGLLAGRRA